MIDNDPKLKDIVQRIVETVHPTRIYLFGSRAHGNAREDSDYDLLLIHDGKLTKRQLELIIYRIFNQYQFAADLFILTTEEYNWQKDIATTLAREVHERGVAIYE